MDDVSMENVPSIFNVASRGDRPDSGVAESLM
jgi:hypothetical protein